MKSEKNAVFDEMQSEIIKQDNKKAGKKYALILAAAAFAGSIIGFACAYSLDELSEMAAAFHRFMEENFYRIGWIVSAFTVLLLAVVLVLVTADIRKGKKEAPRLLEKDDVDELNKIERKLSVDSWLTDGMMVLEYFYFAVIVFGIGKYLNGNKSRILLMAGIVILLNGLAVIPFLQQKVVDLTRMINPEKKGSVYDLRFQGKWVESCDEAQQLAIYKAGYQAFRAVNMLCIILWTFFVLLGLLTGAGFLPVVSVLLIWGTLVCVYHYYGIRLSD